MTSQNQKSILSQVTLDTSKINKQSLSTSILPPLHTGESSYIVYKHKKSSRHQNRPLPFGSTSSRVIEQLEPKLSSHIVSYESNHSNYKNYTENPSSPFGSSENRFKDFRNFSPGPGLYKCQQTKSIKNSPASWKFSKVNRDLDSEKNNYSDIGPGSYKIEQSEKPAIFRQKIAEKYREQRKKYVQILALKSNKSSQVGKLISLTEEKSSLKHQSNPDQSFQKAKKVILKSNPPLNRFTLKDSTKKYVLKSEKENTHHECDSPNFINKNFTYNFIQKADNAFSSYIPKVEDIPGPGYYPQKRKIDQVHETFNFKSGSVRTAFPTAKVQGKKPKPKLSELL